MWRTMTLSFFVWTLTAVDVNDRDAAPARKTTFSLPGRGKSRGRWLIAPPAATGAANSYDVSRGNVVTQKVARQVPVVWTLSVILAVVI